LNKGKKPLTVNKFQEDEENIIKEDEIFSLWVKLEHNNPTIKRVYRRVAQEFFENITESKKQLNLKESSSNYTYEGSTKIQKKREIHLSLYFDFFCEYTHFQSISLISSQYLIIHLYCLLFTSKVDP
jgi:hypothetical protein